MPILTIDDSMYRKGENIQTSVVIITNNRFEVVRRLTDKKFNRNDVSFIQFLDCMIKDDVIQSYETNVMRLLSDEIWNAP